MEIITITILTLVILAGGTIIKIASTKKKIVHGNSMGVLGEIKSGKTSFLYRLGLVTRDGGDKEGDRTTTPEPYITPAIIKTKKGDIKILPGNDIGGTDRFQKKYTADYCDQLDIVFYIFNGVKYIEESEYRKHVNSIMLVIYERFKKAGKDYGNAVIIASRADKFENREEMLTRIQSKVSGEKKKILEENFYCINCRSKEEVLKVAEQLFDKGVFNK